MQVYRARFGDQPPLVSDADLRRDLRRDAAAH